MVPRLGFLLALELAQHGAVVACKQVVEHLQVEVFADELHAAVAQRDLGATGMQTPWTGDDFTVMGDVGGVGVGSEVSLN